MTNTKSKMTQTKFVTIFVFAVLFLGLAPPTMAKDEYASPMVNLHYDGNWPSDQEAQQLRDDLYYNMAIQSYLHMQPALNTIGMRDGGEKEFGEGYNVVTMWKGRMDAKTWIPTPNCDIMYSVAFLTLRKQVRWLSLRRQILWVCLPISSSARWWM